MSVSPQQGGGQCSGKGVHGRRSSRQQPSLARVSLTVPRVLGVWSHLVLLRSWALPLPPQNPSLPPPDGRGRSALVGLPATLGTRLWLFSSDQQQSLRQDPCAPARRPGPGQSPRACSPERAGHPAAAGAKHREGLPVPQDRPHQLPGAGLSTGGCGRRKGLPSRLGTKGEKMLVQGQGKDRRLGCSPLRPGGRHRPCAAAG